MSAHGVHAVLTGANGLVGANVARRLLSTRADARLTMLDVAAPDALVRDHVGGPDDRIAHLIGDIADPGTLAAVPDPETVTHVIHTAAVAHVPEWERRSPRRFFEVNLGGTLNVIDWVRTLPALERLLYTSTGGVYGEPGASSPEGPQPEDGPFDPPELYAISKFAAERTVQRMAEVHAFDARAVRFSAVFGPMERPTAGRELMSLPYLIARSLARAEPLRLTRRTLDAGGDFLSGEDVAAACVDLLLAQRLVHFAYNVAFGRFTPVTELLAAAAEAAPAFHFAVVDDPQAADVDLDPDRRRARWNAYATDRIEQDTGWSARPLARQVSDYLEWTAEDPARRCSAGSSS